jgi:hypothetical protein
MNIFSLTSGCGHWDGNRVVNYRTDFGNDHSSAVATQGSTAHLRPVISRLSSIRVVTIISFEKVIN